MGCMNINSILLEISTFNSSSADFSQVYMALPLSNVVYNVTKIESFYTTEFEEFIPVLITVSTLAATNVDDLNNQLNSLSQENTQLQNQLNDMISQSSTSNPAADSDASKQVILELRMALGQGRVESDFSNDFPYTPIIKPAAST